MATTESPSRAHDRQHRRRPFSGWMKRLANLKSSATTTTAGTSNTNGINLAKRKPATTEGTKSRVTGSALNNPYPESGVVGTRHHTAAAIADEHSASLSGPSRTNTGVSSFETPRRSLRSSVEVSSPPQTATRSTAPTVRTETCTSHSDAAPSAKAGSSGGGTGTSVTVGGGMSPHGGHGSTFSSPAPSVRSLTTTLTTIQSTAPSTMITGATLTPNTTLPHTPLTLTPHHSSLAHVHPNHQNHHHHHHHHHHFGHGPSTPIQFTHQFPSSPPASALPSHLVGPSGTTVVPGAAGHPTTYNTATANNLLSDNASILTLASSSKRRRRRSMDTDASVRALAPSSVFGGSRESLPLSVLSGNVNIGDANSTSASGIGIHASGARPSVSGMANPERASVYSSSGVAPALSSERNSYYAGKSQGQGMSMEGGSVKSGLLGHGRNDSITGSINGAHSTLHSPREMSLGEAVAVAVTVTVTEKEKEKDRPSPIDKAGRMSRRGSGKTDTIVDGIVIGGDSTRAG